MDICDEFGGTKLGDPRREARLLRVAQRLADSPDKSIAGVMPDEAQREAAYRLLNNPAVEFDEILAPHLLRTAERARAAPSVIVAHDTTEVGYSTPRAGLGRINDGEMGRGFFMHTALAISGDGRRDPLGVIGARVHMRMRPPAKKRDRHTEVRDEASKESARWWELAHAVSERLVGCAPIHVMDREADDFVLLARLNTASQRFVIRANHDRRIQLDGELQPTLRHGLRGLEGRVWRQITTAPRKPKPLAKTLLPPRHVRTAELEFRATQVVVRRPATQPATDFELPETLPLNVVHVVEKNPPQGYEPIDWKLYTQEPIATPEDIEAIVDAYNTRWVIEEYFKALKTGCALEKRELENGRAILNCCAILVPIAWSLLRLRAFARDDADLPATKVLTKLQITVLQRYEHTRLTRDNPTVKDAYLAIALLGGFIKNNKRAGWLVMMRGYQKLLSLSQGAALMLGVEEDRGLGDHDDPEG